MSNAAVVADHVSKLFRLYHERNNSLKSAIMRGGRTRYDEFWALDDVSFEIPEGSTYALIGENGSGKTTMLKCIARILRPDKGEIRSDGKLSALLELGAGFHPELSGRENVYLNGSILGLSKKQLDARFDEIVGFAGLEQFIDSPVKTYSSGMYVRLGFSVAINVDPDILLIDEVLAVGDAEFQRRCFAKFAEMRAQGKTIVMVTHALSTVREFCDEVALLEHGKLRARGPAGEVIDQYLGGIFVEEGDSGAVTGGRPGVVRVELVDDAGRRVERARTGAPMTLRMHFKLPKPVEAPLFGLSIHSLDGLELVRTTTADSGARLGRLEQSGFIDFRVERLPLLAGMYDVGGAVAEGHDVIGAPEHTMVAVDGSAAGDEQGVVSLGGEWDVSTDGEVS